MMTISLGLMALGAAAMALLIAGYACYAGNR